MEHEPRAFFAEHEQGDVKGFTVIEAGDGQYHIGEKWLREDADDVWISYWITAEDLARRCDEGACEKKGKLTEEQFAKVVENVDLERVEA